MSRCVIKKAFIAASLGLAMFVTSPAYAQLIGTDEIVMTCQSSLADELFIESIYTTLPLVERPPELKINEDCMVAWRVIKAAGFVVASETTEMNLGQATAPEAGPVTGNAPAKGPDPKTVIKVLVVMTRFECQELGTCLFE